MATPPCHPGCDRREQATGCRPVNHPGDPEQARSNTSGLEEDHDATARPARDASQPLEPVATTCDCHCPFWDRHPVATVAVSTAVIALSLPAAIYGWGCILAQLVPEARRHPADAAGAHSLSISRTGSSRRWMGRGRRGGVLTSRSRTLATQTVREHTRHEEERPRRGGRSRCLAAPQIARAVSPFQRRDQPTVAGLCRRRGQLYQRLSLRRTRRRCAGAAFPFGDGLALYLAPCGP
jgi:hypothetical protein